MSGKITTFISEHSVLFLQAWMLALLLFVSFIGDELRLIRKLMEAAKLRDEIRLGLAKRGEERVP